MVTRLRNRVVEKTLENKHVNWATTAKECVDEYNKTIHSTTKFPPIYLLTGSDPDQLIKGNLEENRMKALENSNKIHEENKRRYDKNRKIDAIGIGKEVYVEKAAKLNRRKLDPIYDGPFKVTDTIGNNMIQVQRYGKKDWFHISKIKPVLMLLLISLLMAPISASNGSNVTNDEIEDDPPPFETADPVIWMKTEHKLATQYTFNHVVLQIKDPCEIARKEGMMLPIDIVDCEMAQRKIDDILADNCPNYRSFGLENHQLKKRSIAGMVTAGAIVCYIASTVIGMVGTLWSQWIYTDVKNMEAEIRKIKKFNEKFSNQTVETLKALLDDIGQFEQRMTKEIMSVRSANKILTQIKVVEPILLRFFENIKRRKVISEFDYLFPNITLVDGVDKRYWEILECESRKRGYISLHIITPKVKKHQTILKAHPFTLYKKMEKGEVAYEYVGPKFLVVDEQTGCVRLLHIEPKSHEPEVFLLFDKQPTDSCAKLNLDEAWRKTRITFGNTSYEKIQTHVDENAVYLYCNGSTIEYSGKRYQCENYVYKLNRQNTFKLNNVQYKMIRKNSTGTLLTENIQERLAKKIMGGMENFKNYKREMKNLDYLVKELEKDNKKYWEIVPQYELFWGAIVAGSLIIGCLVILLSMTIVCCVQKRRNRKLKKRLKQASNRIMRMEDLSFRTYPPPYEGRF